MAHSGWNTDSCRPFLVGEKASFERDDTRDKRSHESHKLSYKSWCDQRSFFLHIDLAGLEALVEL